MYQWSSKTIYQLIRANDVIMWNQINNKDEIIILKSGGANVT